MLGSLDEAQFFQVIIQLMGCKRCSKNCLFLIQSIITNFILVEVGTFTGYTSLTIALALPSDGHLIACDISDEYVRQDLWKKAGVQDKITLKVGPAVDTLKKLLEENGPGSFDFIFIDADKPNYMNYYQLAIELVRSNGLIVIDNTLWKGKVVDQSDTSEQTAAIRQVNDFVRDDQRIDISFLRLGDGTTLCRKK
jgi:predicted O-methyltransferase YrrM